MTDWATRALEYQARKLKEQSEWKDAATRRHEDETRKLIKEPAEERATVTTGPELPPITCGQSIGPGVVCDRPSLHKGHCSE